MADTTSFFRHGRVVLWYAVTDGKIEFFTFPWTHPVSKKALNPVTPHIADMYFPQPKDHCEKN